jgi:TPP-dependent pyruvate/acetoin dehydrogenase alpha subunit
MRTDLLIEIFRKSLLTRLYEDRFIKLSMEGVVPPLLHPGAGQEIAQIAALAALNDDDPVLYSHRGVAYMVARGVSLAAMLADSAGREGGTNNGKGGIMHVVDLDRGIYGESGTLGGGLVVSVGMGMALKYRRSSRTVVHFFGDGGANRGTFHESLNWAAVQKLPCIYICENNGWAVSVPVSESTSVENISDRAGGYGIPGVIVDGADPDGVFSAVATAATRARSGGAPRSSR